MIGAHIHRKLFLAIFAMGTTLPIASAQEPLRALALNQSFESTIKPKEIHSYSLNAERGQFVQVAVDQKGMDVALRLFSPDGKILAESNLGNWGQGPEIVSLIADEPISVRVEVLGLRPHEVNGTYSIKLREARAKQFGDEQLIAAENLLHQAFTLTRTNTSESNAQAIEKFEAAIPTLEKANDKQRAAVAYVSIARIHTASQRRSLAIPYFEKAIPGVREMATRNPLATLLSDLGSAYFQVGEFQKALECHTETLEIRRALKDARMEAIGLSQIGYDYKLLGESEKALTYFSQALPLLQATNQPLLEARTLDYMAGAYYLLDQMEQALASLNRSAEIQQRAFNRFVIKQLPNHLAIINLNLGRLETALKFVNLALEAEENSPNSSGKAQVLASAAEVNYKLGDTAKARALLSRALPLSETNDNPRVKANIRYWQARLDCDEQKLDAALGEIEDAIRIVEDIRSRIVLPEFRASYHSTVERYYELYIEVFRRLAAEKPNTGFDEKAFIASEQARARSLVELLNEARADLAQAVSPELVARERELQRQLNAKAQVELFLSNEPTSSEQLTANAKEIQNISNSLLAVQAEMRKQNPSYAALTQPPRISVKEIQQTVDDDTILLEFRLGDAHSLAWAITKDDFHMYELPSRGEIEKFARLVYQMLTKRNQRAAGDTGAQFDSRLNASESQYRASVAELGRTLLTQLAPGLNSRRMAIVADGALEYVPFGALPDPNDTSRPLIANHEIVNLPSASSIALLRRNNPGKPSKTLAVFADPVFAKDDIRVANARIKTTGTTAGARLPSDKVTSNDDRLSAITRLPFSRREANAILSLAPPNDVYAATDFEANHANATNPKLAQYRFVHFATHGWIDSTRPELSGVVLSLVDRNGLPQNGVLRLHEIYNLKLNADLVVLSACQTALGKDVRGEGLIGLTRGFMYAGAPRVVATLWRVDDAATAELMAHFYRFMLREKLSPAAALRAAQLEIMKQKRWQSPYYWAGFVLQGEWR